MKRIVLLILLAALLTPALTIAQDDNAACDTLYEDLTPAQQMVIDDQYDRIQDLEIVARTSSLDTDFVYDLQDWSVRAEYMDRRLAETELPECDSYATMQASYDDLLIATFKLSGLIGVIVDLDSRGREIPERYVEMLEDMLDEMSSAITDWTIGSVLVEQPE